MNKLFLIFITILPPFVIASSDLFFTPLNTNPADSHLLGSTIGSTISGHGEFLSGSLTCRQELSSFISESKGGILDNHEHAGGEVHPSTEVLIQKEIIDEKLRENAIEQALLHEEILDRGFGHEVSIYAAISNLDDEFYYFTKHQHRLLVKKFRSADTKLPRAKTKLSGKALRGGSGRQIFINEGKLKNYIDSLGSFPLLNKYFAVQIHQAGHRFYYAIVIEKNISGKLVKEIVDIAYPKPYAISFKTIEKLQVNHQINYEKLDQIFNEWNGEAYKIDFLLQYDGKVKSQKLANRPDVYSALVEADGKTFHLLFMLVGNSKIPHVVTCYEIGRQHKELIEGKYLKTKKLSGFKN